MRFAPHDIGPHSVPTLLDKETSWYYSAGSTFLPCEDRSTKFQADATRNEKTKLRFSNSQTRSRN